MAAALAGCDAGAPEGALARFAHLPDAAFTPNPYVVYELRPDFTGDLAGAPALVNSSGYRGAPLTSRKSPERRRILCLGGSFTFGLGAAETEAFPAQLASALEKAGGAPYEVANLGVPGHTSHEVAGAFTLRWLDLEPDAIVISDLDADALPLQTQDYSEDYGHFWRVWVDGEKPKDPCDLGRRVVARWPGSAAQRARTLTTLNTSAFERNLAFVLDAAAGRGVRAIVCLPDPRGRGDSHETWIVERLREAAQKVCISRPVTVLDSALVLDPKDPSPAASSARMAVAAAEGVSRLPW
jgi:hypothetical protein